MSEVIPFMDLGAQTRALETELKTVLRDVIEQKQFIQGPAVDRFNAAFLKLHGGRFGVGCANGTTAITVALRALGIGPGDEVLVPNHTFFATAEAVVEVGGIPVLIEVDEAYHQIDLADAERRLTARTKAIIPVHLYGLPEPMDQIVAFAKDHGLFVVEDCAQAQLATWQGQPVGTFGEFGTFSFYPGKNLGAFGDAGFILTQNAERFAYVERYINHGRQDKYLHEFFGTNARMDGLQGAVLEVKLRHLAAWTDARQELARVYDEALKPAGFRVLGPREGARPVYHLYVVEVSNRDEVMAAFKGAGIGCGVHYPVPLSLQPAFKALGYAPGQFPVSERRAKRILSLPFFPEMTPVQVNDVLALFKRVARP